MANYNYRVLRPAPGLLGYKQEEQWSDALKPLASSIGDAIYRSGVRRLQEKKMREMEARFPELARQYNIQDGNVSLTMATPEEHKLTVKEQFNERLKAVQEAIAEAKAKGMMTDWREESDVWKEEKNQYPGDPKKQEIIEGLRQKGIPTVDKNFSFVDSANKGLIAKVRGAFNENIASVTPEAQSIIDVLAIDDNATQTDEEMWDEFERMIKEGQVDPKTEAIVREYFGRQKKETGGRTDTPTWKDIADPIRFRKLFGQ